MEWESEQQVVILRIRPPVSLTGDAGPYEITRMLSGKMVDMAHDRVALFGSLLEQVWEVYFGFDFFIEAGELTLVAKRWSALWAEGVRNDRANSALIWGDVAAEVPYTQE
jgi:hypothetical protein